MIGASRDLIYQLKNLKVFENYTIKLIVLPSSCLLQARLAALFSKIDSYQQKLFVQSPHCHSQILIYYYCYYY